MEEKFVEETDIKLARKKAMQLLEHMDRTEKGLSDKLRQAGFSVLAIEDAMEYVRSFGYIDDGRYARNYIAGRMNGKSKQKLFQELMQKGIRKEIIQEAWEEEAQINEPDERNVLRKAILKKYDEDTQLEEKEARRLYGYLLRRGFQFEDISSVLNELNISQKKLYE